MSNYAIRKKSCRPLMLASALALGSGVALAESDKEIQEKALKAREMTHEQHQSHQAEQKALDSRGQFRGVFYGYLPCAEKDCAGFKMTLSLNQKNNYLLVTQYARQSSRESFEKGKYSWDESNRKLVLNPRQDGGIVRQFRIEDASTLVHLNADGTLPAGDKDDYSLRRSDAANNREMHIH